MYIYQDTSKIWHFGVSEKSIQSSGKYWLDILSDDSVVIRELNGLSVSEINDIKIVKYKDSEGIDHNYASMEEFIAATTGFFANSPSSEAELAISSVVGAKADEAATTDTGTFPLIALVKRALQGITTIFTRQTDGSQKTQVVDQNGHPLRNPDHVDCTSTTNVVYRGFNIGQGTTLLVNKIDMTDTTNITRTWGTGTWVGRASIVYS